jgi:sulfite reductase (ferredoxin)
VEQGRVKDEGSFRLKTGLRAIVDKFNCDVRLTPHQNVVLCGIRPADKAAVEALLREHGVKPLEEVGPPRPPVDSLPGLPI